MYKKICILDYGLGNIKSLQNALKKIGYNANFFSDNKKNNYDIIFIPGVGSFNKASEILLNSEYSIFLNNINKKAKIFGICLGMQLFASSGNENGLSKGLNFIEGFTDKLSNKDNNLILPFVGYFNVHFHTKQKFFNEFNNLKFYFVHSYKFNPLNEKNILSTTQHQNTSFCSAVLNDRYIGTQFHPEKSGDIGLEFLAKTIKNLT